MPVATTEVDHPWFARIQVPIGRQVAAMQKNRFWIEILGIATIVACALGILFAIMGTAATAVDEPEEVRAATTVQQEAPPTQAPPAANADGSRATTYEGMVTCQRCGAKHNAKLGRSAQDCVLQCIHSGAGFVLVDAEKTYTLEGDWRLLKKIAGQRARVVGQVHGNTITVESIAAES